MSELLLKDESFQVIGACIEVHKYLGSGFLEAVYQEALGIEFAHRSLPFVSQPELSIRYQEVLLQTYYKPDFICFDQIIVEIKAIADLTDKHRAQVHNCLKATGRKLGLLVNFHSHPKLEFERIVH